MTDILAAGRGVALAAVETARVGLSRAAPRRGSVPLRAADITPRWLETTLGVAPGSIGAVAVVEESSGTATRARLEVTGDLPAGTPDRLFAKLTPRSFGQHVLMNLFDLGRNEVLVYESFGDDPPIPVPRCFAAQVDARWCRSVVLLEDLGPTAQFRTVEDAVSVAEAEAVVDALADFHAAHWGRRYPADLGPLSGRSPAADALGDLIRAALLGRRNTVANELVPPAMRADAAVFHRRSRSIDAFWAAQPRTLLHGDPHLGNLYFVDGAPGFLDWQVAMAGCAMRDVAYFATASVEPDVLRAVERGLVDRWTARVGAAGVEVDPDEQWLLYRIAMTEFWLAAVSTAGAGESMQPAAVARQGVRRAVAACEAHDSFGLLLGHLPDPRG